MSNVLGLNSFTIDLKDITCDSLTVNNTINIPDGSLTISDVSGLQAALNTAGGNETLQVAYDNSSSHPQITLDDTNSSLQIKQAPTQINVLEILDNLDVSQIQLEGDGTITANTFTDGTININGGSITGASSITSTTLTDGTAILSTGVLSNVSTINTVDLIASDELQGDYVSCGASKVDNCPFFVGGTSGTTIFTVDGLFSGLTAFNPEVFMDLVIDSSGAGTTNKIKFSDINGGHTTKGSIEYDFSANELNLFANSTEVLTIKSTELDLNSKNITNVNSLTTSIINSSADLDFTITGELDILAGSVFIRDGVNVGWSVGATSAVHVAGLIEDPTTITVAGAHVGREDTTNNYGINLCHQSGDNAFLKFSKVNVAYEGSLEYTFSTDTMKFTCGTGTQLTLNTTTADFQDNEIKTTGDLTINTNKFSVNSTSGFVGIGTTTQEHSELLHVQGSICCDGLCVSGTDGVISDRQFTSASTFLDLTTSDAYNNDYTLRIWKSSLGNARGAKLDSQGDIELAGAGTVRVSKNFVVESGNTVDANLNSTRGQLISILGEENAVLNVGSLDFNFGNGSNSDKSGYGMIFGVESVKLKKFTYNGRTSNNTYNTTTKIVFRGWINGVAQAIYAYIDFSDTTNGSASIKRFCNKFSSSSTSQIDIEPVITSTFGAGISWETITLSGTGATTCNAHRFCVIAETQDNL
jgi:hypothetical protein